MAKLKPWQRDGSTGFYNEKNERVCTGARMGIPNCLPDDVNAPVELTLERCRWVDGDYLEGGAYFGQSKKGEWIWCAYNDEVEVFVRAGNRGDAVSKVITRVPGATCITPEGHIDWCDLDEFTRAYITAALWTSVDTFDNMKRDAERAGYAVAKLPDDVGPLWQHLAGKYVFSHDNGFESALSAHVAFDDTFEAWRAAYTRLVKEKWTDPAEVERVWVNYNDDTNLETHYTADDLSQKALKVIIADCEKFQTENAELLKRAGQPDQNGHDFWLTRTRCGTGFWDRKYEKGVADGLTEASHAYSEGVSLYVNADGGIGIE
jgi:hypothetical protein